jgi:hypothetical protein
MSEGNWKTIVVLALLIVVAALFGVFDEAGALNFAW